MIVYKASPPVSNAELSELFASAWNGEASTNCADKLTDHTVWVCAFDGSKLVGFVKVLWDGGKHGFVLDTTTHAEYQRRGIATELLRRVSTASKDLGIVWLHVDFEPKLTDFYRKVGYLHTHAGLLNLGS